MVKKTEKGLYIKPIAKGTTIDHLPAGSAFKILNVVGKADSTITVAIRVPSRKLGVKDLVFVENKILSKEELEKIALIAPNATINIIENNEVKRKLRLSAPKEAHNIIVCINPNCITNKENVPSRFYIDAKTGKAKCHYCERIMSREEYSSRIRV
jgi:aspartate carbamoyltransferase regulatory subunit